MKSKHYLHGGDLDSVARNTGLKREELIDFSGNINPFGISTKARDAIKQQVECISTYPDRYYTELREVVGKYCGADKEHIIVGNGCSELITQVIKTLSPKKTLMLAPTYSEYEREVRGIGGILDYYLLKESEAFKLDLNAFIQQIENGYNLIVICNPNNPTSTVLSREELEKIVKVCREKNIFVMIDETYIEFCDYPSKVTAIALVNQYSNLMVLRGISKFFSAPGLRFGYGITSDIDIKAKIRETQIPWSVNSLAELAVKVMLEDKAYIDNTHQFFVQERNRILKELIRIKGIKIYSAEANFVLLKILVKNVDAASISEKLLEKGMMVRDASSFVSLDAHYMRFCFLDSKNNDLLLKELTQLLNKV